MLWISVRNHTLLPISMTDFFSDEGLITDLVASSSYSLHYKHAYLPVVDAELSFSGAQNKAAEVTISYYQVHISARQGSNAVSIAWSKHLGPAPGNFGIPNQLTMFLGPPHHDTYSSYACNKLNVRQPTNPTSDRSRSRFSNCMVHSHCASNGTDTITSDIADVHARCKLMSQRCAMARVTESQLMPSKRSPCHRPNLHRAKLCSHWDPITPEAEWNLILLPFMVRSQVCIKIIQVTHASRFQDLPIETMIPQPLCCGQRHGP